MSRDDLPRPPRTYKTGAITKWLRRCALAGIVFTTTLIAVRYREMPDAVPLRFTSEPAISKQVLAAIAVSAVLLAALIAGLSRIPDRYLYPVPITGTNAQFVYREGERAMTWLLLPLLGLYLGLALSTLGINGFALMAAGLFSLPILLFVRIARVNKAATRRPD